MKRLIVESPCAIIRIKKNHTTNSLHTNNPIKALWSYLYYPETRLLWIVSTDGKTERYRILLEKQRRP